jgi:hypothetical protein
MGIAGSRIGLSNIMYNPVSTAPASTMKYTLAEVSHVRRRGSSRAGASKRGELHPQFGDVSPCTQPVRSKGRNPFDRVLDETSQKSPRPILSKAAVKAEIEPNTIRIHFENLLEVAIDDSG